MTSTSCDVDDDDDDDDDDVSLSYPTTFTQSTQYGIVEFTVPLDTVITETTRSTQRFSTVLHVQPITLHTVPSVHKVNMLAAGASGVGTGGSGGSMNRGHRGPGTTE